MLAVRYVTLLALAVWLGGLVTWRVALVPAGDGARLDAVGYVCGGVIVLGLLVQKFMGPPPRAFIVRILLVSTMLAVAIAGALWQWPSSLAPLLDIALGLSLLFWYVRE